MKQISVSTLYIKNTIKIYVHTYINKGQNNTNHSPQYQIYRTTVVNLGSQMVVHIYSRQMGLIHGSKHREGSPLQSPRGLLCRTSNKLYEYLLVWPTTSCPNGPHRNASGEYIPDNESQRVRLQCGKVLSTH